MIKMTMLRLDKYLTDMGVGTRSEVKTKIRKGQVAINQTVVKRPDSKVSVASDIITVDGQVVGYVNCEYYMLNKPQGVVSATVDNKYQTVVDLIQEKKRRDLFPVGRLDIDTEGLLLITNDGELSHRLLSPKRHVDKCYLVVAAGILTKHALSQLEQGINIGTAEKEEWTKKALCKLQGVYTSEEFYCADNLYCDDRVQELVKKSIKRQELSISALSIMTLSITEGKYHQIKRMLAAVGLQVVYLKRLSMGALLLDETLGVGEYRKLTKTEIDALCENESRA